MLKLNGQRRRKRRSSQNAIWAILAVLALLAIPAAAQEDDLSSPKLRIDWSDFKKQYDEKTIEVIDVRGEDAYAAGHIPGARLVPLAEFDRSAPELTDKLKKLKKPIVLYCA